MKLVKQILKEFWIPFTLSLGWTIYKKITYHLDLSGLIANFGTAFFLTSWFSGQILRVLKQQKTESSFENVLTRIENIISKVETIYSDLKGYSVGGESFCYLDVTKYDHREDLIFISHVGAYPLTDLKMRLINLNNPEHEIITNTPLVEIGTLGTSLSKLYNTESSEYEKVKLEDNPNNYIKYKITFYCKKGFFEQDLRIIKFENKWYTAIQIIEHENVVYTKLTDNYPIANPFK